MTKNVNQKSVEEVSDAIKQLNKEGIAHPDYEQIQEKMKSNKEKQAALKKKVASRKKAQKKQEFEEAPDQVIAYGITSESAPCIKKKLIKKYVDRINAQRGSKTVRQLDILTRWRIGGILNEAAENKVCVHVREQAHIVQSFASYMQIFNRTIYFVEPLLELLDFAKEKEFQLRWNHILEAIKTKSYDLCLYWLRVAIENNMTFADLGRAITNNGDRKVKGCTRKAAYLNAVKENVETHENLAMKGPQLMVSTDDIEPLDMPIEDFVAKLFSIVDVGWFNIRTIR